MKIFGSNKNSRHVGDEMGQTRRITPEELEAIREETPAQEETPAVRSTPNAVPPRRRRVIRRRGQKLGKGAKAAIVVLIALCAVAVLLLIGLSLLKEISKPPTIDRPGLENPSGNQNDNPGEPDDPSDDPNSSDPGNVDDPTPVTNEKYTFVIAGKDKISGNTDTIMVATFDATAHKLNVVSIPRDTLINVPWTTRKVNALYTVGGPERLMDGLKDILGFKLDFYVVVDLDAFVTLIDAIGGVYFDVPRDMNYDDAEQGLHIHVKAGPQWLDGETAIGVVRFRKGYADADIGRIATQQKFLKAAAEQILEKKDQIPLTTFAEIFLRHVKTNLSLGNIIWFAQEALKMEAKDIYFSTLPGNYEDAIQVNGRYVSYVTIDVDEWLEMVNTLLNPYDTDVTVNNVNILTRDENRKLYATTGEKAGDPDWGVYKKPVTQDPTPTEPDAPVTDEPVTDDPVADDPSDTVVPDEPDTPTDPDTPTGPDEPVDGGSDVTDEPVDGGGTVTEDNSPQDGEGTPELSEPAA